MNIAYIANVRMPIEKAPLHRIMEMFEAFVKKKDLTEYNKII